MGARRGSRRRRRSRTAVALVPASAGDPAAGRMRARQRSGAGLPRGGRRASQGRYAAGYVYAPVSGASGVRRHAAGFDDPRDLLGSALELLVGEDGRALEGEVARDLEPRAAAAVVV